jgi:hypothetical protein
MASVIRPNGEILSIDGQVRVDSTSDLDLLNLPATYTDATTAISVQGGAYIGGNAYVGGTLLANGDIVTLGNTDGGTLIFNSNISSDLIPSVDGDFNVGNSIKQWGGISSRRLSLTTSPAAITSSTQEPNSIEYITDASPAQIILADGVDGQIKILICTTDLPNNIHVNPVNMTGFTDIVLTEKGQSVTLVYTNSSWFVIGNYRASITI